MKRSILLISAMLILSAVFVAAIERPVCSDSDGGKNIRLQGTVSVGDKLTTFEDSCFDRWTLFEYTCDGDVQKGEKIECETGCAKGQCLQGGSGKETLSTECTDTDPQDNPYVVGSVSGGKFGVDKVFRDYCKDTRTVFEYNCTDGKDVACEGVCEGGTCHARGKFPAGQEQCLDNDEKNFFFQGSIAQPTKSGRDVFMDYCYDRNNLIEQTCPGPLKVNCPRGCSEGTCNGAVTELTGEAVPTSFMIPPQEEGAEKPEGEEIPVDVEKAAEEAAAQAAEQAAQAAEQKAGGKTWLWVLVVIVVIAVIYFASSDKGKKKKE